MEGYIIALLDMHTRRAEGAGLAAQIHKEFVEELKALLEYNYELEERRSESNNDIWSKENKYNWL